MVKKLLSFVGGDAGCECFEVFFFVFLEDTFDHSEVVRVATDAGTPDFGERFLATFRRVAEPLSESARSDDATPDSTMSFIRDSIGPLPLR